MKIDVKVTPNAKASMVVKAGGDSYNVKIDAPARDGKANERLIAILAEHFNTSRSRIRILKGFNGRNKVVEVLV